MTRVDIEKAAVDSCVIENDIFNPQLTPYYEQGFKDGANWRINSVWHDANEIPCRNKWYIAQIGDNAFDTFTDSVNWKSYARSLNIIRWAYIEDLIPSKEE